MLAMISKRAILNVFLCILLMITLILLAGCNPPPQEPAVSAPPVDSPQPDPTETLTTEVQPPTAAPTQSNEPLAAKVKGEGILLREYEAEFERYSAARVELGKEVDPEEGRQAVLSDLIDQVLLAQAAYADGFSLSEDELAARVAQLGDPTALAEWQAEHGYSEDSFRIALQRQAAAAWQRDRIVAGVPAAVEQVQARQMLVFDKDLADRLHNRLKSGADFATLARQIDPTGGELGWFPRGYLTLLEIEEAAFTQQPGQHSAVIETAFGYHIVQTIAYEAAHPVSSDVRRFLQHQALQDWLEEQRARGEIEILIP
jgi:peptidyl-prolyl cis-trans isomerase C